MAIKILPLTDSKIRALKPAEKPFKKFDGGGLFLLVSCNGSKLWRMKYKAPYTNKERLLTFGSYPKTTLQRARELRDEARELIKKGVDPQAHKIDVAREEAERTGNTFKLVAQEWLKTKTRIKEDTKKDIWRSLELHIFPSLGNVSISKIRAQDVVNALQPTKKKGALETVKRVTQRVNEVLNYAVNVGLINANPCIKVYSAFETPKTKNQPAITPKEFPEFLKDVERANMGRITRLLFKWQLITMTRSNEAVGAKWEEIDFQTKVWTVPANRMKMKKEHNIPLPPQAMAILEELKEISISNDFIFPSAINGTKKPMNSQTVNAMIKRVGYGGRLVAHGLRTLASTILNTNQFNPDAIEKALAHTNKDSIRAIYNRADYLEQRRSMMNWWADYIDKASEGEEPPQTYKGFSVVNG